MGKNEQKMQLPKISVDEFFTTQDQRNDTKLEKIINIPIKEITDFPNHPFKVIINNEMEEMSESIKERGVLVPTLVRPKPNGGYEMIAGHRRKKASELANKDTIPCIVRELTNEEATIIMVDSNLQREELLPSERAFAYKMKLEAMKKQGVRTDLTSVPMAQKLDKKTSREILGEEVGESQDQIRRYIRLTELIPEILNMVDEKRVAFRPAVEISYLTTDEQNILFYNMEYLDVTPSLAQAIYMKKLSQEDKLTTEKMEDILSEEKPNQITKLKFNEEKIRNVLPRNIEDNKIEDYVVKAIEFYGKHFKQKQMDSR